MPPGVDDLHVGDREFHDPGINEVVRILIDEKRSAGSELFRSRQVVLPDSTPFSRSEVTQEVGKEHTPRFAFPCRLHDSWQVTEFVRSVYLAVTGEDLLDERRPGSWESDHQYWCDV